MTPAVCAAAPEDGDSLVEYCTCGRVAAVTTPTARSLTLRERGIGTCPTCGWTPRRPTRGGPPVHIAVVIDDVIHPLGRCPSRLVAAAANDGGGSL